MAQSIFTPLYFANYMVDQIQDAKNKVIDTFVFDTNVKGSLKEFVEAQRSFAKQVNTSTNEIIEFSTVSIKETIEKAVKTVKI